MNVGTILTSVAALLVATVGTAGAQAQIPGVGIDGPPPPMAPEVISRDAQGRATVRAVRLTQEIQLDGRLDEAVYQAVPAIDGFLQSIPDEGAPATESTEVWILFDNANIYVSAKCWDSAPESDWVANEMRRDTSQLRQNDTFGVVFDTFYDRRNGVMFYANPLAGFSDFAISNEGNANMDWNPVWDVRTGRFEGGWTVEMQIPFKSLRYRPGSAQVWGVQLRRAIRRKNEWTHLTLVPRSAAGTGSRAVFRISANATLVGLEAPAGSKNLEFKPYGISRVTTDRRAAPPKSNDFDGDFGLDAKYGVTQNLTADFTYNTDFAQVEVDEQQVNLTRFNLVFPEKREFFLEGRGIFDFARGGGARAGSSAVVPTLFFSRRIGLQSGRPVPILGGGRLTGKLGPFDVGALNIQTDDEPLVNTPSTNFSVLRIRRNVLRRSSIGALFTNRSHSEVEDGSNQTYGLDATFSFFENVNFLGYYAKTTTPGRRSQDESYQGRFSYDADAWGFQVDQLLVGNNFNPEVGFLRRDDFRRSFVSGRISPRPASIDAVRKFTLQASLDYLQTADEGLLETRERQVQFQTEFNNSDTFTVTATDVYELLEQPFDIATGVRIPAGGYEFLDAQAVYAFGLQRPISGNLSVQRGSFYDGDITAIGLGRGRVEVTEQLSLEPSISFNWVDLPQGTFSTQLAVTRVSYTFTPRMYVSGLLQYNSSRDTFSTNLRLRWEYEPGSELFVVYTEDRNTEIVGRFSELSNRALVIKFNRLFRL